MPRKQTQQVFIFEPARFWDYCGGAIIVAAPTYEAAIKLLMKHPDLKCDKAEFFRKESDIPGLEYIYHEKELGGDLMMIKRPGGKDWDVWILTKEFSGYELAPGIITANWNYA